MKHNMITAVYLICLVQLIPQKVSAQNETLYAIESLPLEVSASRTVSLSFGANIISVDRGSAELLAQKVKRAENVVLVKAARKDVAATSLTVITADGELHVFDVRYQEQPSSLGLQLITKQHHPSAARISEFIDESQIKNGIQPAQTKEPNMNRGQRISGFSATVDGLYVDGPIMYLRLSLENRSVIDYDVQILRIFTEDKKQVRRSASQREEISIIGRSSEIDQVKASERRTFILAIPKLTFPKSKRLVVRITEQSGARGLSINLRQKDLNRIAPL